MAGVEIGIARPLVKTDTLNLARLANLELYSSFSGGCHRAVSGRPAGIPNALVRLRDEEDIDKITDASYVWMGNELALP